MIGYSDPRFAGRSMVCSRKVGLMQCGRFHPGERIYTFWDYFRNAWARDAGLRIDHLLLSPSIVDRLVAEQRARMTAWLDENCARTVERRRLRERAAYPTMHSRSTSLVQRSPERLSRAGASATKSKRPKERSRYARTSLRRGQCLLSMPSAGRGRVVVSASPGANDYWPVASLTHFVVKLVFAAPLSFLSCAAVSQDA